MTMRAREIQCAALTLLAVSVAGCDITALDNYEAPSSKLTGRVVYNGEPVQVRSNEVELELWEQDIEEFELNQKIQVHVAQEGTFSAVLFDGRYKLNLLPGSGPWVTPTPLDTIRFELRGSHTLDVPVTPYYVVRDEQFSYDRNANAPWGTVTGTFRVGKVNTSRAVEYVGVYVGVTSFVDRINSLVIANNVRERTGAAIATQLDASPELSDPISIAIPLPNTIYNTNSPAKREKVFVRVGIKTQGVAHMIFSPIQEVAIGPPPAE